MKALAIVLAVVLVVLAVLSWQGIGDFAPWLGINGHHNVKHPLLFVILAALCLLWARMQAAPRAS
jgi:hypothetical protein